MYHMKIDSFLSVIEDLFGRRLQVVTFSFDSDFIWLSKFTACFLHCVCDAQIEKKSVLRFFYSWYFIQVMFHSFSSRATKNMPHENQKRLVWFGTKRNVSFDVRDQFEQIQKCTHSTKCSCIIHYFITFAAMHLSSSLDTFILEKHSQMLFWWI